MGESAKATVTYEQGTQQVVDVPGHDEIKNVYHDAGYETYDVWVPLEDMPAGTSFGHFEERRRWRDAYVSTITVWVPDTYKTVATWTKQ